jgi:hypothetical protein
LFIKFFLGSHFAELVAKYVGEQQKDEKQDCKKNDAKAKGTCRE